MSLSSDSSSFSSSHVVKTYVCLAGWGAFIDLVTSHLVWFLESVDPSLCVWVLAVPGPLLRVWYRLSPVISSFHRKRLERAGLLTTFLQIRFPLRAWGRADLHPNHFRISYQLTLLWLLYRVFTSTWPSSGDQMKLLNKFNELKKKKRQKKEENENKGQIKKISSNFVDWNSFNHISNYTDGLNVNGLSTFMRRVIIIEVYWFHNISLDLTKSKSFLFHR